MAPKNFEVFRRRFQRNCRGLGSEAGTAHGHDVRMRCRNHPTVQLFPLPRILHPLVASWVITSAHFWDVPILCLGEIQFAYLSAERCSVTILIAVSDLLTPQTL
jgi:hypothetical protein